MRIKPHKNLIINKGIFANKAISYREKIKIRQI